MELFNSESKKIVSDPINVNNPISLQVLVICSALAVTIRLDQAIIMTLAVVFVLCSSNVILSLIRNYIPARVRIVIMLSVIASLVSVVDELLKASFYDGINIGEDEYLKSLVERLGLDWSIINKDLNTKKWKKVLDDNLKDMYAGNCWGVPSFKVTDEDGNNPFYVWGQDRMWLIKEEINKRLG